MTYTFEEKLKVVKRELALRRQVYPGAVACKKMKQAEADHQIAVMDSIRKDYERAVARGKQVEQENV